MGCEYCEPFGCRPPCQPESMFTYSYPALRIAEPCMKSACAVMVCSVTPIAIAGLFQELNPMGGVRATPLSSPSAAGGQAASVVSAASAAGARITSAPPPPLLLGVGVGRGVLRSYRRGLERSNRCCGESVGDC